MSDLQARIEADFYDDDYECWKCGGEGWEDRYDEDPLWYGHELYRCSECQGRGTFRPAIEEIERA